MIPTSTDVTIQTSKTIPSDAANIVVLLHKDAKASEVGRGLLDDTAQTALDGLLSAGVVKGKSNEVTIHLLASQGSSRGKARRLIVIGLGNANKFSAECLREAGGAIAKTAKRQNLKSFAILLPQTPATLPGTPDSAPIGPGESIAAGAIAEGILLGNFNYEEYKGTVSKGKKQPGDETAGKLNVTLVSPGDAKVIRTAIDTARAVCDGQNFARTIASRPGNDIKPPSLAKVAQAMAREVGLDCRILDEKQMQKLGMGGILAVGMGSGAVAPPRMIVLEHRGSGKAKGRNPILVVGKAITFDTGGISIKPAEKMGKMIFDKCGGMAVLGLMYAVAKLNLPMTVVGILSSAENHISETAYRPGDILKMYNGVTVEVTNTDAEGRLVLGDALAWGIETYKPQAVIDLATLTGGVIVALGKTMAGVMGNSDALVAEIQRACDAAGERIWRLPLGDDQREQIKSEPADIVNSAGREGHPLQGGAFLSHFVPEDGSVPWAHLDIAGVADTEKEMPFYAKGATGWGVRTLVEWVKLRMENPKGLSAKPAEPASASKRNAVPRGGRGEAGGTESAKAVRTQES